MPPVGRRGLALAGVLVALTTPVGSAELVPDLYEATVFVTGEGEETRGPGLAKALSAVLVKVSGDPRLASDPYVEVLEAKAADFVDVFSYRDRMEGIPVHDEQGSRDRPYDLTVSFDVERVDAALQSLASAPWTGPRPELLVIVSVRNEDTGFMFMLAADGAKGRDMREAMVAAAEQYGMPVMLPTEALLQDAGSLDSGMLWMLARDSGADVAISGTLTWSDTDLGWVAEWQMTFDSVPYRWQSHRVSFDNAFRSAIGGAAQILSGHGAPE